MRGEGAVKLPWLCLLKVCIPAGDEDREVLGLGAVHCCRNRAEHSDRVRKIHKRQKLVFERT